MGLNWFDSLLNLVTGLGTSKDPTSAALFNFQLLDRRVLENMYRSDWVARRIVEAPADDMTREWRQWQASQEQIETIEEVEKTHALQKKVRQAMIRGRLYGGAAIVIGVEDGKSSEEAIDLDTIKKDSLKFLVVLNRYELNAGPRVYNVYSPWYTRPEYYTVASPLFGFSFEGGRTKPEQDQRIGPGDPSRQVTPEGGMVRVHPSRVIEFIGNELPDWRLAPLGAGWGDSVLQTVDDALRDVETAFGSTATMMADAKTDVIKIPDFTKRITTQEYKDNLLKRFMLANQAKSTVNALILDKDEEWERIATDFNGIPNVLHEFMTWASGAADIPVSRLFGSAPGRGLGQGQGTGGGGSDIKNYNDRIASYQKTTVSPNMASLDQVLIRSALGSYDPSVFYEWNPLEQMDKKDKAQISYQKAQTAKLDVDMGLINEDALRRARINQLIEDGVYPGLDDAIEEFGEEPDIPEARVWSPQIDPHTGQPIMQALPAPRPQMTDAWHRPKMDGFVWSDGKFVRVDNPKMMLLDASPRTLYVRRNVLNADEIIKWAKDQGFPTTLPPDDLHVTVCYSREPVDWMKMGQSWYGGSADHSGNITVDPGGPRLVEKFGNAIVLLFSSSDIQCRHDMMVASGASHDFPDYQPHITITYDPQGLPWESIEPYRGKIELGPEIFEEVNEDWSSGVREDEKPTPKKRRRKK